MNVRYGIVISTWKGYLAYAVHYYGRVWRYDEDAGRGPASVEVEYTMTTADAKRENKEAKARGMTTDFGGDDSLYMTGDLSERYIDRDQLVRDGLELIRKTWGHTGPVEDGEHDEENEPVKIEEAPCPKPSAP